MIDTLPFAITEHMKGLTDERCKDARIQNKNINTLAILMGINAHGKFGCPGEGLVASFPGLIRQSVNKQGPGMYVFPNPGQIMKSKLLSMEGHGLLQCLQIKVGDALNEHIALTELGDKVLAEMTMTCTVTDNMIESDLDNAIMDLAHFLIHPLMTETTFFRGTAQMEGNEWFPMAKMIDNIVSRNSSMSASQRVQVVVGIAGSMLESGLFELSEQIPDMIENVTTLYARQPA